MKVTQVKRWCNYWKTFTLLFVVIISYSSASVTPLDSGNIDSILANNQVVFVNFYADWCRFSQHLKPIFEEASKKFVNAPAGQVAFASVDCDRQPDIAQKYHVNKYPTLKLFRFGELIKKEYRGQRSAEALAQYIEKQTESKIQQFTSKDDLNSKIDNSKRNIIAYFVQTDGQDYKNLQKISSSLQDDCAFWLGQGEWVQPLTQGKGNIVAFKSPATENEEMPYAGPLDNYDSLNKWVTEKCIPVVREITFENAEELTEEGVPFLILFRSIGDTQSEKLFSEVVSTELWDQRASINCLMADGKKFAHPLHHLGKTEKDLPLIAIDSFRHMYLFSDFKKLSEKGHLRQFVMDLHSGKLHREFHHGPDPTPGQKSGETQPPSSVFKQLKPSDTRYSLLNKDEL